MDSVEEINLWDEEDAEFVVLLTDETAPPKQRVRVAKKFDRVVASLPSSAEADSARATPNANPMTQNALNLHARQPATNPRDLVPDLAQDFASFRCWISIDSRVGTLGQTVWFLPRPGWVPMLSDMRARYVAFLFELLMGCWPGWSYHTKWRIIYETDEVRLDHRWSYCILSRLASPLAGAKLGPLRAADWVFSGDRIVATMKRVFVPAWLQHSPNLYQALSFLWKYVPNVDAESRAVEQDKARDRILLPLHRGHPHIAQVVKFLHDSFAKSIFPARPSTKPMYELLFDGEQARLHEIPGMKQRLRVYASRDEQLKLLSKDELERRLLLGHEIRPRALPSPHGPWGLEEDRRHVYDMIEPEQASVRVSSVTLVSEQSDKPPSDCAYQSANSNLFSWPCPDDQLVPSASSLLRGLCASTAKHRHRTTRIDIVTHAVTHLVCELEQAYLVCLTQDSKQARQVMAEVRALPKTADVQARHLFGWCSKLPSSGCIGLVEKHAPHSLWAMQGKACLEAMTGDHSKTSVERIDTALVADSHGRPLPYCEGAVPAAAAVVAKSVPDDERVACDMAERILASTPSADDMQTGLMQSLLSLSQELRPMAEWPFVLRSLVNRTLGLPVLSTRSSQTPILVECQSSRVRLAVGSRVALGSRLADDARFVSLGLCASDDQVSSIVMPNSLALCLLGPEALVIVASRSRDEWVGVVDVSVE